jgi:hypothetical protein
MSRLRKHHEYPSRMSAAISEVQLCIQDQGGGPTGCAGCSHSLEMCCQLCGRRQEYLCRSCCFSRLACTYRMYLCLGGVGGWPKEVDVQFDHLREQGGDRGVKDRLRLRPLDCA